MSHQSELIATDIHAYLKQHQEKELLRFLTCGSVDDGKSTLIGRMLLDSKMVYEDQLASVQRDSKVHGTTGGDIDPALLTDGLKAEREQGITIDVAYRYFSTARRKFIIADTPGHEQYTRNMATGASTCDLAIILVDARKGIIEQTKRHSFIVSLLGIKHAFLAVNKMDLVGYEQSVFERIRNDYIDFASRLAMDDLHFLPISALKGDNLVSLSPNMPWYQGSTLMHMLETVHIASDRNMIDFRLPVQYVNRPNLDFRGFCGTIASGIVRKGDQIMVLPSRKKSRVKSIVTFDGELEEAFAPLSVTVTLEDEIDISRGDTIVHVGNVPKVDDRFEAMLVWMDEDPLVPGKQYLFRQTNKTSPGTISTLRYQIDVNTLRRQESPTLKLNQIGRCSVRLTQPFVFDAYMRSRSTGSFVVIDRMTHRTVGAGMILDRESEEHRRDRWDDEPAVATLQASKGNVGLDERQARFGQRPVTILITGLTGSGKTTLAYATERVLFSEGRAVTVIDGQNMRLGINRDLGFSPDSRSENLRRSAEVAKLMNQAGSICVCALVAPDDETRKRARDVVGESHFLLVHLRCPIEVCRARSQDMEEVYAAAEAGEIGAFPGVSSEYQEPTDADLVLDTQSLGVEECVEQVLALLRRREFVE